jgi:hypothetical protein
MLLHVAIQLSIASLITFEVLRRRIVRPIKGSLVIGKPATQASSFCTLLFAARQGVIHPRL